MTRIYEPSSKLIISSEMFIYFVTKNWGNVTVFIDIVKRGCKNGTWCHIWGTYSFVLDIDDWKINCKNKLQTPSKMDTVRIAMGRYVWGVSFIFPLLLWGLFFPLCEGFEIALLIYTVHVQNLHLYTFFPTLEFVWQNVRVVMGIVWMLPTFLVTHCYTILVLFSDCAQLSCSSTVLLFLMKQC
jgi:hypothetical protein